MVKITDGNPFHKQNNTFLRIKAKRTKLYIVQNLNVYKGKTNSSW